MLIQDVGDDVVRGAILPDTLVATELEKVQERREGDLVVRKATVGPEAACAMYISVVRRIRLIGLLNPQRHGLSDQPLEFDAVRDRNGIDGEFEMTPELRMSFGTVRQQDVGAERRVEFDQPFMLY